MNENGHTENKHIKKEEPLWQGGELARAYVPPQVYAQTFSPQEGLKAGTIFPELVRPYPPRTVRPRRRLF